MWGEKEKVKQVKVIELEAKMELSVKTFKHLNGLQNKYTPFAKKLYIKERTEGI